MSRKTSSLIIFSLLLLSFAGIPLAGLEIASIDYEIDSQASQADEIFPRGPTVHMVNKTSAMIYWETNTATNATVNYGNASNNLDSSVSNPTTSKEHSIWIDGLTAGTTVYYEAVSDGTSSEVYHFKTEPEAGTPFNLIVMGDPQPLQSMAPEQSQVFRDFVDMARNEEPHLVIITGDSVDQVSETDETYNAIAWGNFLNVTDKLGHYTPIYGVIGNHDTRPGETYADWFLDSFHQYGGNSTWFSFDYAGAHFTFLDTEVPETPRRITGDQYDWLVNDLQSTDKEIKYVVAHQPFYPVAHVGSAIDANKTERARLQNLFEEENVTMFLSGHDHVFQRITVNGVVHVTSSGVGPKLYRTPWGGDYNHYVRLNTTPQRIDMETVNIDGDVTESYTLPYEGSIEIAYREVANSSSALPDEAPEIYFSEVPEEKYFSWDGGENSTELGTLPDTNGLHTLDVYAKGSNGEWNHKYYEFTTVQGVDTGTTTPPPGGINPLLIASVIGVAAVIIVMVVVYRWKMSGS